MIPISLHDHLQWSPASGTDEQGAEPSELGFRLLCVGQQKPDCPLSGNRGASSTVVVRRQSSVGQAGIEQPYKLGSLGAKDSPLYDPCNLVPLGETNLVLRAARLLACRAGLEPYGALRLIKRIPISAGMGGGSSDAAATLVLVNKAWGVDYPLSKLIDLATELGSDVPFFLARGMAICRGRGECIEPVQSSGRLHFVVVKPPVGLATAEVFARVAHNVIPDSRVRESRNRLARLIAALRCGDLSKGVPWMTNRLEEVAESMTDWISRIRRALAESGCCGQWMTGSGSACVGLVRSVKQANHVGGLLASRRLGEVFVTRALTC